MNVDKDCNIPQTKPCLTLPIKCECKVQVTEDNSVAIDGKLIYSHQDFGPALSKALGGHPFALPKQRKARAVKEAKPAKGSK